MNKRIDLNNIIKYNNIDKLNKGGERLSKLKDTYWFVDDYTYVFTTNIKNLKTKINNKPSVYEDKGKIIAYQYTVDRGSEEERSLLKELGLSEKDRDKR